VAITFEWQQVFRLIYTNGTKASTPLEFWMGDSRGRWDGDTLLVDVTNHNDQTWFDMAGNFHSDALHVVERFTMVDADTIRYEATIDDPKVFTRPWTVTVPLARQKETPRLLEYQCRAEMEEARGEFRPEPRTWYRKDAPAVPPFPSQPRTAAAVPAAQSTLPRMPDGKPDISGYTEADAGGANWGFEPHNEPFTPGGRGVLIDPKTGGMPYQAWAREEKQSRSAGTTTRPRTASQAASLDRCTCPRPSTSSRRRPTSSSCSSGCHGAWSRWTAGRTCRIQFACGRVIRSGAGMATRWSSRPRT
jgi:hypothetical protein